MTTTKVEEVARAIMREMGRNPHPTSQDLARAAIDAADRWDEAERKRTCKHPRKMGGGGCGESTAAYSYWRCLDCGASYDSRNAALSEGGKERGK